MIVSWNWLKEYVELGMSVDELTDKLTMSGLNLEGVDTLDDDTAIDLEVTSNRPDCLGHVGVAREISVLFDLSLNIPVAKPSPTGEKTADLISVTNECEDLCPQYLARVIQGVKVGPSPDWLQTRLKSVGIESINNVVDVTNYVLMETGQPLHAFDLDKLAGGKIIVRRATEKEKFLAINHSEYELDSEMCVIADEKSPVALAGVMGGAESEIGDQTVNLLIETANFAPLSVRSTARKLSLHSDSSYRFERGVDVQQLDYVSQRCCELILQVAGGTLSNGGELAGNIPPNERPAITLRFDQVPRLLGIDVTDDECCSILETLGVMPVGKATAESGDFMPPSWRRDLTREVDLIEEIARIHGYENIPEDAYVPLTFSQKTTRDRVLDKVCACLTAFGFSESITLSFVDKELAEMFRPRGDNPFLYVDHATRRKENLLRQSLVPSLLRSRRENERQSSFDADLFEIAKVYLRAEPGQPEVDVEPTVIGLVSGLSFAEAKGVIERLLRSINSQVELKTSGCNLPEFVPGRGAEVFVNDRLWGWLGELDRSVTDRLDLRDACVVAELDLSLLIDLADLTPQSRSLPQFPAISRDLNLILDESTNWDELASVIRESAGPLLESVSFGSQYRGEQIDVNKKSYVVTLNFRADDRTLTHNDVEEVQKQVLSACESQLAVVLR